MRSSTCMQHGGPSVSQPALGAQQTNCWQGGQRRPPQEEHSAHSSAARSWHHTAQKVNQHTPKVLPKCALLLWTRDSWELVTLCRCSPWKQQLPSWTATLGTVVGTPVKGGCTPLLPAAKHRLSLVPVTHTRASAGTTSRLFFPSPLKLWRHSAATRPGGGGGPTHRHDVRVAVRHGRLQFVVLGQGSLGIGDLRAHPVVVVELRYHLLAPGRKRERSL